MLLAFCSLSVASHVVRTPHHYYGINAGIGVSLCFQALDLLGGGLLLLSLLVLLLFALIDGTSLLS